MRKKMKNAKMFLRVMFITAVFLCSGYFVCSASETPKEKNNYIDGEVLVKYRENRINLQTDKNTKKAELLQKRSGLKKIKELKNLNMRLLRSDEKSTEELLIELKNDPEVEYAVPNYKRYLTVNPSDAYFGQQYGLSKIGAPSAWDEEADSDQDVIVAVIDTGVDLDHPDLIGNLWDGSGGCLSDAGEQIPGGCPNHGWNFADENNNPDDSNGHGTIVAGIIGAVSNNGSGISGTSYKNKLKIMAINVFDVECDCIMLADEIQAINFAKNNGAKVINASFGYLDIDLSGEEKKAIDAFAGIFVAAAGNSGQNNDAIPHYPSDYSSANIISAAATDSADNLASFSNYGAVSVDVGAPGVNIFSTFIVGANLAGGCADLNGDGYDSCSGTSFATPYVSGVAGMVYSKYSAHTMSQVRSRVINLGDTVVSLAGKTVSGKRINLYNSLTMTDDTPVLTQVAPVASPTNDNTPSFTFHTTKSGTISYAGSCAGDVSSAEAGNVAVTFNALADGTYNNCFITVTDLLGKYSSIIVNEFIINTAVQIVSYEVTNKTKSSAIITWSTYVSSTGSMQLGIKKKKNKKTKTYNINRPITVSDGSLTTSHSVFLSRLKKNKTYYFKITAISADGNQAVSTNILSFKTNKK